MKKEAALPIRLTTDEKKQLIKIAEETGLTVSSIVRLLVTCFVGAYAETGGKVTLPLDWQVLLKQIKAIEAGKQ